MSNEYTRKFQGTCRAVNENEHKSLAPVYVVAKRLEADIRILMNLTSNLYTSGITQRTMDDLIDISDDIRHGSSELQAVALTLKRGNMNATDDIPTTANSIRKGEWNSSGTKYSTSVHDYTPRCDSNGRWYKQPIIKSNGKFDDGVGVSYTKNGMIYRASCDYIRNTESLEPKHRVYDILGHMYEVYAVHKYNKSITMIDHKTGKLILLFIEPNKILNRLYPQPPYRSRVKR